MRASASGRELLCELDLCVVLTSSLPSISHVAGGEDGPCINVGEAEVTARRRRRRYLIENTFRFQAKVASPSLTQPPTLPQPTKGTNISTQETRDVFLHPKSTQE